MLSNASQQAFTATKGEGLQLVQTESFVAGEYVGASSGATFKVYNPANCELLGEVTALNAEESAAAIDTAQQSFSAWANLLPQQRSDYLRNWFSLISDHREELAQIITAEQGKPLAESLGEIDYAASFVEFYAEEAKRPNIESVTSHLPDAEMELWIEPVGVVAIVTPWNFPAAMITRKASAALAAGCTLLIHPSFETPFSALALAELSRQAGFPAGVINVVTGMPDKIVSPWLKDSRVRAFSFTGSTPVGRMLYAKCAQTVKRLILELGGNAPFMVFDDADLTLAVDEAIKAKFATSGQDCLGANRIYVHSSVYKDFCAAFSQRVQQLSLGSGEDNPDIGPLINKAAIIKQQQHVQDALDKGAQLLCGGKVATTIGELFFQPTVLSDVSQDALIMHEENFGPVAALCTFDKEEAVFAAANNTEYGLVAYLHTQDPRRIFRACRKLQFGMIAVNRTKITGAPIPFGGMKQSGIGREGARLGMQEYMEVKYLCRDWA